MNILKEGVFNPKFLNKYASIMAIGNGYMGIRASNEEDYMEETRGLYVAGVYNKFLKSDPAEVINLPDMMGVNIELDGERFSLLSGEILSYDKQLNIFTGELKRNIIWRSREGKTYDIEGKRFVARHHKHIFASKLTIVSLDAPATLKCNTGIDAQQTNQGKQHLIEEEVKMIDEHIMQGCYRTTESNIEIALSSYMHAPVASSVTYAAKNRRLLAEVEHNLEMNTPFTIEKINAVYTSMDSDLHNEKPGKKSSQTITENVPIGFEALLARSAWEWTQFWKNHKIDIKTSHSFDQLALNTALYHIEIMTPAHDERYGIGAKGLTGEGYKGHVFWDSEIFIAPYHMLNNPKTARKLLKYRYLHLKQAKEKAAQHNYEGALFPWESAFSGNEETPEFAAINIRTGKRQKVASAAAEHHIVADIAYATAQYFSLTKDDVFMRNEGATLLRETAEFWLSRTVEEADGTLSIKDVIGPDEYTEHINNNAYTNYMAYYNVEQAVSYLHKYEMVDNDFFKKAEMFLDKLYLPQPDQELVIPQDDTFLNKKEIELSEYKAAQGKQSILKDYSRPEVNEMQVLKQADVVMLMYLLPQYFLKEAVLKNLNYYEKRTIHDSSLSKAIHAILAARTGQQELAYEFFREACLIDLGNDPHSSDDGIHAASLGALWQAVVFGFVGLTFKNDLIVIDPALPKEWEELTLPLEFQGIKLKITVSSKYIEIENTCEEVIKILYKEEEFNVYDNLKIEISEKNHIV